MKARTSTCPVCGRESARVLTEFERTYPPPAVRVVRFQCTRVGCDAEPNPRKYRERFFWDVVTKKLPRKRVFKCPS